MLNNLVVVHRHRSANESDFDNEQNENTKSTITKRHGGHSEEHTALTPL